MAGNLDALDIDVLGSAEIHWSSKSESAEDLCEFGFIRCGRGATTCVVLAEDARVLSCCASGDRRILAAGCSTTEAPGVTRASSCRRIPTNAPRTAPDNDSVTASDDPGV